MTDFQESEDGFPLGSGSTLSKVYELKPLLSNNKDKWGLGKITSGFQYVFPFNDHAFEEIFKSVLKIFQFGGSNATLSEFSFIYRKYKWNIPLLQTQYSDNMEDMEITNAPQSVFFFFGTKFGLNIVCARYVDLIP